MSHPALEGPGPGPTSIQLAAIRTAITGLGIPNFDRILRITIDAEWVDVQWADPTGLQVGTRYPIRSAGVECPQCHTLVGRPHTDFCTLSPDEVWDGVLPAAIPVVRADGITEPPVADWVDDGCRCPDPNNHQPDCPAAPTCCYGDFTTQPHTALGPHHQRGCERYIGRREP